VSDGLDRLESKNAKAREHALARQIPPSRHQPRRTLVSVAPEPVPEVAGAPQAPTTLAAAATEATPARSPGQAPNPPVEADLVARRSVFLAPADDAFLESVYEAGRFDPKGRFDASKSAVVRLALGRLAKDLAPADIVEELRRRAPKPTSGRPRH